MPNHVTNRLIIKEKGDKLQKVLDFLKGNPGDDAPSPQYIDFNNIVPMPKELDIESGSDGETGMEYLLSCAKSYDIDGKYKHSKEVFESLPPERQSKCLKMGKQYLLNIANHGCATWYDWCRMNWGTKWNAYESRLQNSNEIWFKTAWSGVGDLLLKLSKKFPEIEFDYTYSDEDTGYNTGTGIIKDGVSHIVSPKGGSNEAYELAFELNPERKDDYELMPEGYVYKEECVE